MKTFMKDTTLLKVLISFYNAEKHIVSCIKDFKAQINADFRCIFVDNGSSDKSYKNKSFHAFGQLIFLNKKNPFQWNSPHSDEWRNINADRQIFIPAKTHSLVRLYIALIKARIDFAAKIVWNMTRLQEKAK